MNVCLLFLLSVFLCACGGGSSGVSSYSSTSSVTIIDKPIKLTLSQTLDNFFTSNDIKATDAGFALMVKEHDKVVYEKFFGLANKNTYLAIASNTGFQLASISKPFTAIAILQLYEKGLLNLDDAILKYLPTLSQSWAPITIKDLLAQQSGIPDYLTAFKAGVFWSNDKTNDDVLAYFSKNTHLLFTPKAQSSYSSTNYLLLAEVIKRVSGKNFSVYMNDNIFKPAGMVNTYIADGAHYFLSTDALNLGIKDSYDDAKIITYGGIGQVSSLDDLNLFIDQFLHFKILSKSSVLEILKANGKLKGANGGSYFYGYGWMLASENPETTTFYHSGVLDGFRSLLYFNQLQDYQIIFLGNNGDASSALSQSIVDLIVKFYKTE
jgi:CubicO group peptidase (beta-lactamase class C family)